MEQPRQSLIDRLNAAAHAWAEANDRSLARLATLVTNDGKFFARLVANPGATTTTATLERFARFLLAPENWPNGTVAPAAVGFAGIVGVGEAGLACDHADCPNPGGGVPSTGQAGQLSARSAA